MYHIWPLAHTLVVPELTGTSVCGVEMESPPVSVKEHDHSCVFMPSLASVDASGASVIIACVSKRTRYIVSLLNDTRNRVCVNHRSLKRPAFSCVSGTGRSHRQQRPGHTPVSQLPQSVPCVHRGVGHCSAECSLNDGGENWRPVQFSPVLSASAFTPLLHRLLVSFLLVLSLFFSFSFSLDFILSCPFFIFSFTLFTPS